MGITKHEATYVGKIFIPFTLAIILSLLLADAWAAMSIAEKATVVLGLVFALLLIYRKKVERIVE